MMLITLIILAVIFGVGFYFLPVFIAIFRKHNSIGWLAFLNFLLGWTLLGWVFCIAWAIFGTKQPHSKLDGNEIKSEIAGVVEAIEKPIKMNNAKDQAYIDMIEGNRVYD